MQRMLVWIAGLALAMAEFGNLCPTCLAGMKSFEIAPAISSAHCASQQKISAACAMPSPVVSADESRDAFYHELTLVVAPAIAQPVDLAAAPSSATTRFSASPQHLARPPTLTGTVVKKE